MCMLITDRAAECDISFIPEDTCMTLNWEIRVFFIKSDVNLKPLSLCVINLRLTKFTKSVVYIDD